MFFRINLFKRQSFSNVLQNRCSKKFHNFHKKTPVLEFIFNKVAGFLHRTLRLTDSPVLKNS